MDRLATQNVEPLCCWLVRGVAEVHDSLSCWRLRQRSAADGSGGWGTCVDQARADVTVAAVGGRVSAGVRAAEYMPAGPRDGPGGCAGRGQGAGRETSCASVHVDLLACACGGAVPDGAAGRQKDACREGGRRLRQLRSGSARKLTAPCTRRHVWAECGAGRMLTWQASHCWVSLLVCARPACVPRTVVQAEGSGASLGSNQRLGAWVASILARCTTCRRWPSRAVGSLPVSC